MSLNDLVYPECATRFERIEHRDAAVTCANKTAMLGSGVLMAIVIVIAIIVITFTDPGHQFYIAMGVLTLLAVANATLAGTVAGRKWDANEARIQQLLAGTPGLTRAAAADTLIQENMQREQLAAAQKLADATNRNADAHMMRVFRRL